MSRAPKYVRGPLPDSIQLGEPEDEESVDEEEDGDLPAFGAWAEEDPDDEEIAASKARGEAPEEDPDATGNPLELISGSGDMESGIERERLYQERRAEDGERRVGQSEDERDRLEGERKSTLSEEEDTGARRRAQDLRITSRERNEAVGEIRRDEIGGQLEELRGEERHRDRDAEQAHRQASAAEEVAAAAERRQALTRPRRGHRAFRLQLVREQNVSEARKNADEARAQDKRAHRRAEEARNNGNSLEELYEQSDDDLRSSRKHTAGSRLRSEELADRQAELGQQALAARGDVRSADRVSRQDRQNLEVALRNGEVLLGLGRSESGLDPLQEWSGIRLLPGQTPSIRQGESRLFVDLGFRMPGQL